MAAETPCVIALKGGKAAPLAEGRIVVFAGPSVPSTLRPAGSSWLWRPPAMAGDALALAESRPRAVVLIDGFFDIWPAIRHKELLILMARGVPVIGGASMGALRAAELATFGMIGVGRIFDAYARGRLVGDDEVAVMHGPVEMDWAPLTEPLVNVRATVLSAVRRRVVDASTARRIFAVAKDVFYKERTWPGLLDALGDQGAADSRLAAFRLWLPEGRVNLKQIDALACLEAALGLDPPRGIERSSPPETVFTNALAGQVSSGVRPDPTLDGWR